MADEKKDKKPTPLDLFKKKLGNREKLKAELLEGLKSTNSKVRSLAAKLAIRSQEHAFVKEDILPLIQSDKSKKVLRTIGEKINRQDLVEKLEKLIAKTKTEKTEKPAANEEKKS